ncbi:phosphatidylinositol 3- and 4-kinase [Toxoplasma gondii MAS]|uniref:Phosphatidylinositol 3-and 4-kinase n=1 Tax=Toxoplasma gondii MAS TaxID=943118 RepID=A0A086Q863_TOXGO|nr:phosphatidylinositol 3- and 4-kinase [Toxoplasma gondii MAS]
MAAPRISALADEARSLFLSFLSQAPLEAPLSSLRLSQHPRSSSFPVASFATDTASSSSSRDSQQAAEQLEQTLSAILTRLGDGEEHWTETEREMLFASLFGGAEARLTERERRRTPQGTTHGDASTAENFEARDGLLGAIEQAALLQEPPALLTAKRTGLELCRLAVETFGGAYIHTRAISCVQTSCLHLFRVDASQHVKREALLLLKESLFAAVSAASLRSSSIVSSVSFSLQNRRDRAPGFAEMARRGGDAEARGEHKANEMEYGEETEEGKEEGEEGEEEEGEGIWRERKKGEEEVERRIDLMELILKVTGDLLERRKMLGASVQAAAVLLLGKSENSEPLSAVFSFLSDDLFFPLRFRLLPVCVFLAVPPMAFVRISPLLFSSLPFGFYASSVVSSFLPLMLHPSFLPFFLLWFIRCFFLSSSYGSSVVSSFLPPPTFFSWLKTSCFFVGELSFLFPSFFCRHPRWREDLLRIFLRVVQPSATSKKLEESLLQAALEALRVFLIRHTVCFFALPRDSRLALYAAVSVWASPDSLFVSSSEHREASVPGHRDSTLNDSGQDVRRVSHPCQEALVSSSPPPLSSSSSPSSLSSSSSSGLASAGRKAASVPLRLAGLRLLYAHADVFLEGLVEDVTSGERQRDSLLLERQERLNKEALCAKRTPGESSLPLHLSDASASRTAVEKGEKSEEENKWDCSLLDRLLFAAIEGSNPRLREAGLSALEAVTKALLEFSFRSSLRISRIPREQGGGRRREDTQKEEGASKRDLLRGGASGCLGFSEEHQVTCQRRLQRLLFQVSSGLRRASFSVCNLPGHRIFALDHDDVASALRQCKVYGRLLSLLLNSAFSSSIPSSLTSSPRGSASSSPPALRSSSCLSSEMFSASAFPSLLASPSSSSATSSSPFSPASSPFASSSSASHFREWSLCGVPDTVSVHLGFAGATRLLRVSRFLLSEMKLPSSRQTPLPSGHVGGETHAAASRGALSLAMVGMAGKHVAGLVLAASRLACGFLQLLLDERVAQRERSETRRAGQRGRGRGRDWCREEAQRGEGTGGRRNEEDGGRAAKGRLLAERSRERKMETVARMREKRERNVTQEAKKLWGTLAETTRKLVLLFVQTSALYESDEKKERISRAVGAACAALAQGRLLEETQTAEAAENWKPDDQEREETEGEEGEEEEQAGGEEEGREEGDEEGEREGGREESGDSGDKRKRGPMTPAEAPVKKRPRTEKKRVSSWEEVKEEAEEEDDEDEGEEEQIRLSAGDWLSVVIEETVFLAIVSSEASERVDSEEEGDGSMTRQLSVEAEQRGVEEETTEIVVRFEDKEGARTRSIGELWRRALAFLKAAEETPFFAEEAAASEEAASASFELRKMNNMEVEARRNQSGDGRSRWTPERDADARRVEEGPRVSVAERRRRSHFSHFSSSPSFASSFLSSSLARSSQQVADGLLRSSLGVYRLALGAARLLSRTQEDFFQQLRETVLSCLSGEEAEDERSTSAWRTAPSTFLPASLLSFDARRVSVLRSVRLEREPECVSGKAQSARRRSRETAGEAGGGDSDEEDDPTADGERETTLTLGSPRTDTAAASVLASAVVEAQFTANENTLSRLAFLLQRVFSEETKLLPLLLPW